MRLQTKLSFLLPFVLVLATLAGCGSRPTQTLSDAESALADARMAEKCAPEEFQAAQKALEKARQLADKGQNDEAKKQALAAKKLAIVARNKAMLRKDECEKEGKPTIAGIDPNEFVDKSGAGTGGGTAVEGLKTVFFEFNSFELSADARQVLANNATWMKANAVNVTIEGHCDRRGSTEYNLALGEKRAQVVRNYLKSLGVNADRLALISYGEEKPLDWGDGESAHKTNRRAEFVVRGPAK